MPSQSHPSKNKQVIDSDDLKTLTVLHSEWPKLNALRMAKTLLSFGLSECNRV